MKEEKIYLEFNEFESTIRKLVSHLGRKFYLKSEDGGKTNYYVVETDEGPKRLWPGDEIIIDKNSGVIEVKYNPIT